MMERAPYHVRKPVRRFLQILLTAAFMGTICGFAVVGFGGPEWAGWTAGLLVWIHMATVALLSDVVREAAWKGRN